MSVEEKCNGSTRDDELELAECVSGECTQTRASHDRHDGDKTVHENLIW